VEIKAPLTKTNFWDDLYKAYPRGTQVFCDWIDEYKKAVSWNTYFAPHVKFHDLPHDFQLGVWLFFLEDRGYWNIDDCEDLEEKGLREHITQRIKIIEMDLMP